MSSVSFNPEYLHGRPLGPEEQGHEAEREALKEFAAHRPARSGSSMLGGILTLVGAVLLFVATVLPNGRLVDFMSGHPLYSIGIALLWWGPVALLLVSGVLALASGRLLGAVAGALGMGIAAVVLLHFVALLLVDIDYDATIGWGLYLGLVGSAVALVGGLIALLAARTKT